MPNAPDLPPAAAMPAALPVRPDLADAAGDGPRLAPVAIAGAITIALFFGVFGGWAAFAPLTSAAIAEGSVVVETQRKTLKHLEGGIVGEILVQEGDRVAAGQVLLRLDRTQAAAAMERLSGRRDAVTIEAARLQAERDGSTDFALPAEIAARQTNPAVAEIVRGEASVLAAHRANVEQQVAVLGQRSAQLREEIAGLNGQIAAENRQLELIESELQDVRSLVERGLARRARLLALERNQAEIEGSRSRNLAAIARARQQITEADLRIAELDTSRANAVAERLQQIQAELFDLGERLRASEDVLGRTEIRAPTAGTVVALAVHTPGGVVAPGEALLDIVPADTRYIVEARIRPDDIDVVAPGQPAHVTLTAFSQRLMRPIEGRVLTVSADRLVDPRSGEPYFLGRIAFVEDPASVLAGAVLSPGMQAEVKIAGGERTLLQFLLDPLIRSLNRTFAEG